MVIQFKPGEVLTKEEMNKFYSDNLRKYKRPNRILFDRFPGIQQVRSKNRFSGEIGRFRRNVQDEVITKRSNVVEVGVYQ